MMVRLFFKAKGKDRAILVTDGISATGMPGGTYMLGDMQVEVERWDAAPPTVPSPEAS